MTVFDTLYTCLIVSTIAFNTVLIIAGIYAMTKVCKSAKLLFPLTILSTLIIYSVGSIASCFIMDWLRNYFETCDLSQGICQQSELTTYLELHSLSVIASGIAECTSLWLYCFKYFESSLLFPYIIAQLSVPTSLSVGLKISFWVLLLASYYFVCAMQIDSYRVFYQTFVSQTFSNSSPLATAFKRNSLVSLLLRVLTGVILAVALGLMNFRVQGKGYSFNLKTSAFALNLVLLLLYSVSVAVFYWAMFVVYGDFSYS